MVRPLRLALLALVSLISVASADHVILTGGPAMRKFEDLRVPEDQHDRYWANFVRASTLRMDEIRKAYGSQDRIVWIVYRPAYVTRGAEDKVPYVSNIEGITRRRGLTLIWVDSTNSLISALNARPRGSVQTFDYFGHSNRYAFMLDYGNDIMAASTATLHEKDLPRIKGSIFGKNAYCKSWGCHTAESMSGVWKSNLGVKLEGAMGATNYSMVGHNQLPYAKDWVR